MYPKIMSAGKWQQVVVANEEQERALPVEWGGLAGTAIQAESEAPQISEESLQALCDERNIKYDKRWGLDKLIEALG